MSTADDSLDLEWQINHPVPDEDEIPLENPEDLIGLYFREVSRRPLLTKDEEKALAISARQGDFQARQQMIEHNLRLVIHLAKRYMQRGMDLLDLIEEGNLGLMHALDKFEPDRGYRFSTYATWWICQNIERGLMNQSRTIRLPAHVNKQLSKCLKVRRMLSETSEQEPTARDIAKSAGVDLTAEEVEALLIWGQAIASLDTPLDLDSELSIGDSLCNESQPLIETVLEEMELERSLQKWLSQLTPKQRTVIEQRFGFNGNDPCPFDRLARQLGLTRERVRQIQMEALQRLERIMLENGITDPGLI